jgi:hypothetical protein
VLLACAMHCQVSLDRTSSASVEEQKKKDNKRKREVLALVALSWWFLNEDLPSIPFYGFTVQKLARNPSFGVGKGRGLKRMKSTSSPTKCVWEMLSNHEDRVKGLIHMSVSEFAELVAELKYLRPKIASEANGLTFTDKCLLVFIWIMRTRVAILDSTIHPTVRPGGAQRKFYNGHYKMHGILTHLLVDFEEFIISVITNVKGHSHDSNVASCHPAFKQVLGTKFALGDPGFQGVDYVVAGFKSSAITTDAQDVFDDISRTEQSAVEHVNNFIKKSAVLSKQNKFVHPSTDKLVACVFIVCGLYNYKKLKGHYVG